jgi:hypothetical protein
MFRRPLLYLPLLTSGLCALVVLQMAWHDRRYVAPFLVIAFMMLVPAFVARRRMRSLLQSGDVERVIGTWESSIDRLMYPETMEPLMRATAYAAYGWNEKARAAMSRAVKGPAWDAALEQRLFVETLLDTFEGDRAAALAKAEAIESMPLPDAGPIARRQIARLRHGIAAFARAFAHACTKSDAKALERAAGASPLVHWAMRYAGAVAAIDRGETMEAKALIEGAPVWPEGSAFRVFHGELSARLC